MTKNTLLNIGINLCRFSRIAYIVAFIGLTGLFVHCQISPSSYESYNINVPSKSTDFNFYYYSTTKITELGSEAPKDEDVFTLDQLRYDSLYFNYIKISLILILSFISIKEFQKVIESVKEIKTFQKRNVSSFRKIGKYAAIIALLTSYSAYTFELGRISSFEISFSLFILSLTMFITSEIFKEGNQLFEDNKFTV